MQLILFALKSLYRRWQKNVLAVVILAAGLFLFLVGNAVMDGGSAGLKELYRDTLIGDGAVSFADKQDLSVWGYEDLFSSQFVRVPALPDGLALAAKLAADPAVESACPMLSSPVLLENNGFRSPLYMFGVSGADYFKGRAFNFSSGAAPADDGGPWVVINQAVADQIAHANGKYPGVGDSLQVTFAANGSFVIRALPIAGIVSLPVRNETLDRLCIVDLPSAWELLGLGAESDAAVSDAEASTPADAEPAAKPAAANDPDDMFSQGDTVVEASGASAAMDIGKLLSASKTANQRPAAGEIHFVLLKYKPGKSLASLSPGLAASLSAGRAKPMDWGAAAGQSLRYVLSIQRIFNAGLVLFSLLVFVIFVNTVGNAIMERRSEIGILRALGARRKKVAFIFSVEYAVVGLAAFLVAAAGAWLAVQAIGALHVTISNEVLVNLFGGTTMRAELGGGLLLAGAALGILIPLLVIMALSGRLAAITPRQAMQNGT